MNINDFYKVVQKKGQNSVASLFSYREYIDSKIDDVSKFMAQTDDSSQHGRYLTISGAINTVNGQLTKVIALSIDEVRSAMSGLSDNVHVKFYDDGSDGILTLSNVKKILTDYISELRLQSNFLSYCFEHDTINSSEIFSYLKNKVASASSLMVEYYEKFVSNARDPITALSNFMNSFNANEYTVNSQTISFVNASDYTGSVISAVFANIVSDVELVLNKIWEGITGVFTFFERIKENMIECGKWLLNKALGSLMTRFETIKANSIGILDVPILQVRFNITSLAHAYQVWMLDDANHVGFDLRKRYFCDGSNRVCAGFIGMMGLYSSIYYANIYNLCRKTIDGVNYMAVTKDVYVKGNDFDFVCRIGLPDATEPTEFILQLYPVCHATDLSVLGSDTDVIEKIKSSLGNVCNQIFSYVPLFDHEGYNTDLQYIQLQLDCLIDNTGTDSLIDRCSCFDYDLMTESDSILGHEGEASYDHSFARWRFIMGLIGYTMLQCDEDKRSLYNDFYPMAVFNIRYPASQYQYQVQHYCNDFSAKLRISSNTPQWQDDTLGFTTRAGNYNMILERNQAANCSVTCEDIGDGICVPTSFYAISSYVTISKVFDGKDYIPYSSSNLFPDVVHYQTTNEVGVELLHFIRGILIAAVAVYAARKFMKWRKQRLYNADLKQAEIDALSWDIKEATDPNIKSELIATYYKKRNRLNITYFINNALGIGDSGSSASSLLSSVISNFQESSDTTNMQDNLLQIRRVIKSTW